VEVAKTYGCPKSALVQRAADINWSDYSDINTLAVTAGASAPEVLVEEVIEAARANFEVEVEEIRIKEENTVFQIPKLLRET
jgi:4-hydroxy-3-methylbut-2-enyl diphosphate reductase